MMIQKRMLYFSLACICVAGYLVITLYAPDKPESALKNLSLKQVQDDFSELIHKIETEVPDAFHYTQRTDYELAKKMAFDQLKDDMTALELYRVCYPVIQSLRDAHFAISPPEKIIQDHQISYFPVSVIISDDRLYALEDLSTEQKINKGEEIQAINDIPSKEIIARIKGTHHISKQEQVFFEYLNEAVFHKKLYDLFGLTGDFELKTSNNTYVLKGIHPERFNIAPVEDYIFKLLSTDVGYLKINRLTMAQDTFRNNLEKTFSLLKKQSVNKLIVDIRGNLGGNSVLAKDVLDYFMDTPYILVSGVDYFHKRKRHHTDTRKQEHIPLFSPYKFDGKVVLLSDVLTFSSAHMLQVGFQYYHVGTTIGHMSSQSLYITGQIKEFVLKNSGIALTMPTVNFQLPGYEPGQKNYFTPDYVIYTSLSDRLNGTDVLLNKALAD